MLHSQALIHVLHKRAWDEAHLSNFMVHLCTDLLDILKGVKSWCTLGLSLGIPMEVLQEIKRKRMRAKKRSRKIMTAWIEKEINAWEKLVRALDEVGATSLAYAVAQQHGELFSSFTAIN